MDRKAERQKKVIEMNRPKMEVEEVKELWESAYFRDISFLLKYIRELKEKLEKYEENPRGTQNKRSD